MGVVLKKYERSTACEKRSDGSHHEGAGFLGGARRHDGSAHKLVPRSPLTHLVFVVVGEF